MRRFAWASDAVVRLMPVLLLGIAVGGQQTTPTGTPSADTRRVIRMAGARADLPYSAGVLSGDTLYLSAQPGRDRVTGREPEGIAAQTQQAMDNIGTVLKSAGMSFGNLVKCHVYLASMDDYTGMNKVYGSVFGDRVPARTTVEAQRLPDGAGVQIGCVGFRDLARTGVVQPPRGSLPAPLGPYSAGVWAGDTLYLSGMGGQFPEDRRLPEPLDQQVAQTLVNVGTTLKAAGLGFADLVSSTVYVTLPGEAKALAPAYAPPFGAQPLPPQALVFLPRLPGAIKTEMTFIAARPSEARRAINTDGQGTGAARGLLAGRTLYTRAEMASEAGGPFEEQFRDVLRRLGTTLEDAGLTWTHVAHVQVYLADLADLPSLDKLFRERFPSAPPARTVVEVLPGAPGRVHASLVAVR